MQNTLFERIQSSMSVKHRLIAMSLLRLALGIYMLAFYAMHAFEFRLIWGVHGIIPYGFFSAEMVQQRALSLFLIGASDTLGYAIFVAGILVTFAYTIGYKTRVTAVLFYIFTWSIGRRDFYILNGGDNLLYILAFYMMFVDAGAYFSLDAARRRPEPEDARPFEALFHNFGVLAIMIQLCLLYFTSALYKLQGHMWYDGTAIYYVLRTAEFNLTPLGGWLYHNAFLVTALTYMTLVFQSAWPWLVWNRYARPFLAIGAIGLHLSIAYFMGLYWFSFVMIAAEFAIFSDRDYRWLGGRATDLRDALRRRLFARLETSGDAVH